MKTQLMLFTKTCTAGLTPKETFCCCLHSGPRSLASLQCRREAEWACALHGHRQRHLYILTGKDMNHVVCIIDTVIFTCLQGQWKPQLGNFLGEWTNEVANGSKIIDFTTCGPKIMVMWPKMQRVCWKPVEKLKDCVSQIWWNLLSTVGEMNAQVERSAKRKARPLVGAPAKRACLVEQQKKATRHYNKSIEWDICGEWCCIMFDSETRCHCHGPCNCVMCANKTKCDCVSSPIS